MGNSHSSASGTYTSSTYDIKKLDSFKRKYKDKGRFDLESQVPHLSDLAEHYKNQFGKTKHWSDAVKAQALYNSCGIRDGKTEWSEKAFTVQKEFWAGSPRVTFDDQVLVTKTLKENLERIRSEVVEMLKLLDERFKNSSGETSINDVEVLSETLCPQVLDIMPQITNKMQKFASDIIEKSVSFYSTDVDTKKKLTEFCVIGFGSLAREEATPYSDFEYMFLISEGNKENKDLFEKVAVTSYFLIANLGETPLWILDIQELSSNNGWFWDEAKSGFRIDGLTPRAGHIPTGHLYLNGSNPYISTVDELIGYYAEIYNSPDAEESKTGDVTTMIGGASYLWGDKSLFDRLQEQLQRLKPNEKRKEALVGMLKRNATYYNFIPDETLRELKQLKTDIYRYPSLLLFSLKLYYNLRVSSPDCIMFELKRAVGLSESLLERLKIVYCASQYARLCSYVYYESQCEDMTVQTVSHSPSKSKPPWSIPRSLLLLTLMNLTPVKRQIIEGLENTVILTEEREYETGIAFAELEYYCGNFARFVELLKVERCGEELILNRKLSYMYVTALIHCKEYNTAQNTITQAFERTAAGGCDLNLMYLQSKLKCDISDYDAALNHAQTLLNIQTMFNPDADSLEKGCTYNLIGIIQQQQSNFEEALNMFQKASNCFFKADTTTGRLQGILECKNIGIVQHAQGKYDEALNNFQKVLDTLIEIYGDVNYSEIASLHTSIAIVFKAKGDYKESIKRLKISLSIYKNMHDDVDKFQIGSCHNDIGSVYQAVGDYENALQHYKRSYSISKEIFGNVSSPRIAALHNNFGTLYYTQGNYTEAIKSYTDSLKMWKEIYGDAYHPEIASSHNNIGAVFQAQGDYKQALQHFQDSLCTLKELHEQHPDNAATLMNIGSIHHALGEYCNAMRRYQEAIFILKEIYGNDDHPDIACSYYNMGMVYYAKGEYPPALISYYKSLFIQMRIYDNVNHPEIALSHHSIGQVYQAVSLHKEALASYKYSLSIQIEVFGDVNHPKIAALHNSIGIVLQALAKYKNALCSFEKSLNMFRGIHGNVDHPLIADVINNLGMVYKEQGFHRKALDSLENALSMKMRLNGDVKDPVIAVLHKNIGVIHYYQGNINKAYDCYKTSLTIWRVIQVGLNHPEIAALYSCIGSIHHIQRDFEQALKYFETSLSICMAIYGNTYHPNVAGLHRNIGDVYETQGEYVKALGKYITSLTIFIKVYGDVAHPEIDKTRKAIAVIYNLLGH